MTTTKRTDQVECPRCGMRFAPPDSRLKRAAVNGLTALVMAGIAAVFVAVIVAVLRAIL